MLKSIDDVKPESVVYIGTLLEILNRQPDRYVPFDEIVSKFQEKTGITENSNLLNTLNNTLSYSEGLPQLFPTNSAGMPDRRIPQTADYLANIALIRQTRLIECITHPQTKQKSYTITVRGVEFLNMLQLNKNLSQFKEASDRASNVVIILTILLVALAILNNIPDIILYGLSAKLLLSLIVAAALIYVEMSGFQKKPLVQIKNYNGFLNYAPLKEGKLKVLFIGSGVTLLLIVIIFGIETISWIPEVVARETLIGLLVGYSIFVYWWLRVSYIITLEDKAYRYGTAFLKFLKFAPEKHIFFMHIITITAKTFFNAFPIILLLILITIDSAFSNITGNTLYEILGGVVGAWALDLILKTVGISTT